LTDGGNITLRSPGNLTVAGVLNSSSSSGSGGDITLTSDRGTVTSADLTSTGTTRGGDITITAPTQITTGRLDSSASGGAGGNITLTSDRGTVTSADLTSTGTTRGGDITITAQTQITTGRLDSSASVGDGGNVTLDPTGDVQVTSINAQGGTNGSGGNVLITTGRFFRATDTFNGVDSISAIGGIGGGDVIIRHGGGGLATPFIVGDASINGTAGAIATLNNVISPTRSFPGIYWQFGSSGNIGIITSETRLPENAPIPLRGEESTTDDVSLLVYGLEELFTRQYEEYWQIPPTCNIKSLAEIQATLRNIELQTKVKPAIIYAFFQPATVQDQVISSSVSVKNDCGEQRKPPYKPTIGDDDPLGLLLVTGHGKPILLWVAQARRQGIASAAKQFRQEMQSEKRDSLSYLPVAQKLEGWFIAPLKTALKQQGIQNLVFILDEQLRRCL
jgi:hypothetical protein